MSRPALLFDLDGTLVDTDHLHHAAFAAILAERGRALTLAEYRTHIMGHPNDAILARYFPGEDAAILDRKEAMFRDSLAASVEPVAGIHALLDWAEANAPAAPSSPTRRAPTPSRCSPPPASPTACRRSSSATNASGRSPTPRPTAPRCPARRHPVALGRLRGFALRPPRRPRRPAPMSSA